MDFEILLKRLSPKLKAITHKLNGRFSFFSNDDLYQEAMLHLWKACQTQELSDKTDSFILQNCFFFLKNYIRKIYKKIDRNSLRLSELISDQDEATDVTIFTHPRYLPFESMDTNLLSEDIYLHLSKKEKTVIDLAQDGLTTRQIGQRLGVSHVMIVKIKKKIRSKCGFLKKEFF